MKKRHRLHYLKQMIIMKLWKIILYQIMNLKIKTEKLIKHVND